MTRHFITIEELSDDDLASIYRSRDVALRRHDPEWPGCRPRLRAPQPAHPGVEFGGRARARAGTPRSSPTRRSGSTPRESVEDVGRTIAEMYAIAALRVRRHEVFARMREATNERLSLINLMDDLSHPTQAVADVLTIADEFAGGDVGGLAGVRGHLRGRRDERRAMPRGGPGATRGARDVSPPRPAIS